MGALPEIRFGVRWRSRWPMLIAINYLHRMFNFYLVSSNNSRIRNKFYLESQLVLNLITIINNNNFSFCYFNFKECKNYIKIVATKFVLVEKVYFWIS